MSTETTLSGPFPGALATHLYLDLYGVDPALLNDVELLAEVLARAAAAAQCTVLGKVAHRFQPQGASVVMLVAESHLSIHTWPEHGYAAVDIFTCGKALPEHGVAPIVESLKPRHHQVQQHARGDQRQWLVPA